MKQFRVIAKFEDTIAIINAIDEEDAQEKYWNGEIVRAWGIGPQ